MLGVRRSDIQDRYCFKHFSQHFVRMRAGRDKARIQMQAN